MGSVGCAGSPAPREAPPGAEHASPSAAAAPADERSEAPETTFSGLERRLGQTPWRLRYALEAEGAVVASLVGSMSLADEVELEVAGHFAGAEHDLRLWTQGDRLHGGPAGAPTLDLPRPPELAPALVIGMTRMGLMHNVAMLVGGAAPDHADGGVSEWVRARDLQRVTASRDAAAAADSTGLRFDIEVSGQRTARATLWLDAHGLPTHREVTVEFPEGQMRVVERYEWLLPPPLPEG